MFDYWTRGGKIALVAFVVIGIAGMPTAYYVGSVLNEQAYNLLNSQYVQLMNRYDDLSQLYELLNLEYEVLEQKYISLAHLPAIIAELEATIAFMEEQLQLYVDLIKNMPYYERLIIWSNAVRTYEYQKYSDKNFYAYQMLRSMTRHNGYIYNDYAWVDSLLAPILNFIDNNSMTHMREHLKDRVYYYNWSTTQHGTYDAMMGTINTKYDWVSLPPPWNFSYYIRSSLETFLERIGDDIDQTILLASCLVSSGYSVWVALDLNETMFTTQKRRAFLFVNEPGNPCAIWTLDGVSDWLLLDPAERHSYTEYPPWLSDSYVAANNTDWVDTELEYKYKVN